MGNQEMDSFGKAIEAASLSLEGMDVPVPRSEGPYSSGVQRRKAMAERAKEQGERKASRQRLVDAVSAMDVASAQREVDGGVVPNRVHTERSGLFDVWRDAAGLWDDQGRGALLDRCDPAHPLAAMLLWLDGQSVPLAESLQENVAANLGAKKEEARGLALKSVRTAEIKGMIDAIGFDSLSMGGRSVQAYAVLARSWAHEEQAEARVPLGEWLDHMAEAEGDNMAVSLMMEIALLGEPMTPDHWRAFALGHLVGGDLDGASPGQLMEMLAVQPCAGLMEPSSLGSLMAHAIFHDGLEALVALAGLCGKPMPSLPSDVWSMMGVDAEIDEDGPSLLEYAGWSARPEPRGVLDSGEASGGHRCLAALARLPGVETTLSLRHAEALADVEVEGALLILNLAPMLLVPDHQGETLVHHWARSPWTEQDRWRVAELLGTPLESMAFAPNRRGLTAWKLARMNVKNSDDFNDKMDHAFAQKEARFLDAHASSGTASGLSPRAPRL